MKEIGRYVVESKIGQGAMGEVFKALDYRIYRSVAIKILRMDKFESEEEKKQACNLVLKEARITGKLNHGHITTIYDMGVHEGVPYLVMEYLRGKNLKELMAEKAEYSTKEKLGIISVIAQTLHYAHMRGVMHRDIKPANIMILDNGMPKIMDFGIASLARKGTKSSGKDMTEEYDFAGTPHYMSPEHINRKSYEGNSDVFSLGILAYEWLSGQRPFTGASIKEVVLSVLNDSPPLLSTICDVDQNVDTIITKALQQQRKKRYKTAEKFSDALEMYLNKLDMTGNEVLPAYLHVDKAKIIERLRKKYLFFSDFSEEELTTIFRLSQKRKYISGEYIIREGTVGTKMFIIISGQVSIQNETDGQEIEIERLGPGSCVGEMSLVDNMERSASVVAVEPTMAIAINETVLRLSNPKICLKLFRSLAAMLSEKLRTNDERYRKLLAESQRAQR